MGSKSAGSGWGSGLSAKGMRTSLIPDGRTVVAELVPDVLNRLLQDVPTLDHGGLPGLAKFHGCLTDPPVGRLDGLEAARGVRHLAAFTPVRLRCHGIQLALQLTQTDQIEGARV